ncbi:MAG: hypothetical protein HDQ88_07625 [Clostridia bacterium]|nr:hypothetical protein [Clostridia bacterium]
MSKAWLAQGVFLLYDWHPEMSRRNAKLDIVELLEKFQAFVDAALPQSLPDIGNYNCISMHEDIALYLHSV